MTAINQAASHARSLARSYRSVLELADVLAEIGDVEKAQADAKEAMASVSRTRVEARELTRQAEVEAAIAKVAIADLRIQVKDARTESKQAMEEVAAETSASIQEAKKKAVEIIAVARHEADEIATQVKRNLSIHEREMKKLFQEEVVARARLNEIERELDDLLKRIGKAPESE